MKHRAFLEAHRLQDFRDRDFSKDSDRLSSAVVDFAFVNDPVMLYQEGRKPDEFSTLVSVIPPTSVSDLELHHQRSDTKHGAATVTPRCCWVFCSPHVQPMIL